MLKDLEQIGDYVATANGYLLTRRMSFEPFVKAVESHISAFLKFGSMEALCHLFRNLSYFCKDIKNPTHIQFIQQMRTNAIKWMRDAKQHPGAITFVQNHLLDVVQLWPKVKQQPQLLQQDRLKRDTRAAMKKLQRITRKMKKKQQ